MWVEVEEGVREINGNGKIIIKKEIFFKRDLSRVLPDANFHLISKNVY